MDAAALAAPATGLRAERFNRYRPTGLGYLHMQSTRPQTLAYSLNDSPVGQLAWIVEKFAEWTDPAAALPDQAVDRDLLLALVSICWFTGSGASSAHFTYEGMQAFAEFVRESGGAAKLATAPGTPFGRGGVRRRLQRPVGAGSRRGGGLVDRIRSRRALPGDGGRPICWSASCAGSSGRPTSTKR